MYGFVFCLCGMSRQLQLADRLRTRRCVPQLSVALNRSSLQTAKQLPTPHSRHVSTTPTCSSFGSNIKDWYHDVKEFVSRKKPAVSVTAATSVVSARSENSAGSSFTASENAATAPPTNVLEDIARNLPESSLYNTFKYDVTTDAPYPLWFLDPHGFFYPKIISIAQHSASLLHEFHDLTGMPWWSAIIAGGIIVRVSVLPFTLYSLRNAARSIDAAADISAVRNGYTAALQRLGNGADTATKFKLMMAARKGIVAALHKANCYPGRSLMMPLIQIPIAIGGVLGARHSVLLGDSDFETEGALWFKDLTVHDPTYVLPMLSIGLTYAALEAIFGNGKQARQVAGAKILGAGLGNTVKSALQISIILSSPFLVDLPAGLYILMMTNSLWTLGYLQVVRSPSMYKALTGKDLPKSSNATIVQGGTPSPTGAPVPTMPPKSDNSAAASSQHMQPASATAETNQTETTSFVMVNVASSALRHSPGAGLHAAPSHQMHTYAVSVPAAPAPPPVAMPPTADSPKVDLHSIHFPQFVAAEDADLAAFDELASKKLEEALAAMNNNWPLMTGTPNPFSLRIAAGEAAAPWYISPRASPRAAKKPVHDAGKRLATQVVAAVRTALDGSGVASTSAAESEVVAPVCTESTRQIRFSSVMPDNAPLSGRKRSLSFVNYSRTYFGRVGPVVYGIAGPCPRGDAVPGPDGEAETIPDLLSQTLGGRYQRWLQSQGQATVLASDGRRNGNGPSGSSNGAGGGQNGNGDGDDSRSRPSRKKLVRLASKKQAATAELTQGGYSTGLSGSTTDQTTDSDLSASDEDLGRLLGMRGPAQGRTRRRFATSARHREQAKRADGASPKSLFNSIFSPGGNVGAALPQVSKRKSRNLMRVLKMASLRVKPTPRDRKMDKSASAMPTASMPSPISEHRADAAEVPDNKRGNRLSSKDVLGYDLESELTKIAFTPAQEAASAAASGHANTPDDEAMRLILGSHFEAWEEEEIKAGRRPSKKVHLPIVIDVETVDAHLLRHAPSAHAHEDVEVIRADTTKVNAPASRMSGTVLEDGTYIEGDAAESAQSGRSSRKGLDLAGLFRASDAKNLAVDTTSANADSARDLEPTTEQDTMVPKEATSSNENEEVKDSISLLLDEAAQVPSSADLSEKFDEDEDVRNANVALGYSHVIGPGSVVAPAHESEQEQRDRLAQMKKAATAFTNAPRHIPAPPRRRGRADPRMTDTLTFNRNLQARDLRVESRLSRSGLLPAAVPFSLDAESKRDRELDADLFLQRIAHAVSGISPPPGVLGADQSKPSPIYHESSQDPRVHKGSTTFKLEQQKRDSKRDGGDSDSD